MRTGRATSVLLIGGVLTLVCVAIVLFWGGWMPRGGVDTANAVPNPSSSTPHESKAAEDPQKSTVVAGGQTQGPPLNDIAKPAVSEASGETQSPPTPAGVAEDGTSPTTDTPAESDADQQLKQRLVGFWVHQESGEHWIENRPDGTARMLLKLDFVASLLYGQQTSMELKWDVKDGVLSHTVVSGSPQANVDSLVKAFGETRSYEVLETTEQRMLLKSKSDPDKKDLWTRTAPPKEWQTELQSTEKSPDDAK